MSSPARSGKAGCSMSDLKCARLMLRLAEPDLRAMQSLSAEAPEEAFGFFVQQALEKAFKAWLALLGELYPLTHSLKTLLDRLAELRRRCRTLARNRTLYALRRPVPLHRRRSRNRSHRPRRRRRGRPEPAVEGGPGIGRGGGAAKNKAEAHLSSLRTQQFRPPDTVFAPSAPCAAALDELMVRAGPIRGPG